MNVQHLTDEQLQYCADSPAIDDKQLSAHLNQCEDCRIKLENYRSIAVALNEMPSPAFDFDLAEAMAMKLDSTRLSPPWTAIIAAAAGCLLIVAAAAVFTRQVQSLFAALPAAYVYLLTIPLLVLLSAQCIALFIGHRHKMRVLLDKHNLIAT